MRLALTPERAVGCKALQIIRWLAYCLLCVVLVVDSSQVEPSVEALIVERCKGTKGNWCGGYWRQQAQPRPPPSRGSKTCANDCSGIGNCNADSGLCECPAGRSGNDCATISKRRCWLMGEDRFDKNWSIPIWAPSRCGGICDDNTAMCWCGWGKYRHELPPADGDPLAPPIKQGRPMYECQPSTTKEGTKTEWAVLSPKTYEQLYGPDGWCEADKPPARCHCSEDGWSGEFCELPTEAVCANQCSGHGTCHVGYCRCDKGWYGIDCSRHAAGQPDAPGREVTQPWLQEAVVQPAAAVEPPAGAPTTMRRPLIYVYDLPPLYHSQMLQMRHAKDYCTWRGWNEGNRSSVSTWTYGIEPLMHEMMLQSEHRTFDPEAADFFYMPVYIACIIHPIVGSAEQPAFPANGGQRVMHASIALLWAQQWVDNNFPWWKRRGGRDHIFMLSHDEGACWAPTVIMDSIILTHWGRKDPVGPDGFMTSETSYVADIFTNDWSEPDHLPHGWKKYIKGHTCYDPEKHLAVPVFKPPQHYHYSPLMGLPAKPRDLLMFFRGDCGLQHGEDEVYSRGLRQRAHRASRAGNWADKYKILISHRDEFGGSYSSWLTRAIFCLAPPGEGWTARIEDAILHGCIPVPVMDNVDAQFESILDFDAFSIRVAQADIEKLPEILLAVDAGRIRQMQHALEKVWFRFFYASHKLLHKEIDASRKAPTSAHDANDTALLPRPFYGDMYRDDAFSTIMQWLYSRIAATR